MVAIPDSLCGSPRQAWASPRLRSCNRIILLTESRPAYGCIEIIGRRRAFRRIESNRARPLNLLCVLAARQADRRPRKDILPASGS
jgi:hypothetical protein